MIAGIHTLVIWQSLQIQLDCHQKKKSRRVLQNVAIWFLHHVAINI